MVDQYNAQDGSLIRALALFFSSVITTCAFALSSSQIITSLSPADTTYVTCAGAAGDDTRINTAISASNAAGGGTVVVNAGTCMIDAVNTHVVIKSNVFLKLTSATILQAITNSATDYQIVQATDVVNAGISGGRVIGDLLAHTGSTGEHGYGIALFSVTGFTISALTVSYCWGDGILINDDGNTSNPSRNVTINNVITDHNRRQGLTATNWIGGAISNTTFSNTGVISGTPPKCGIDFEPDLAAQNITNIVIKDSTFSNNAGSGIDFSAGVSNSTGVNNNTITHNTFTSNSADGIRISGSSNNTISNNNISLSGLEGISFGIGETTPSSTNNTASDNTITTSNQGNTTGMGILIEGAASSNIIKNSAITSGVSPQTYAGVWVDNTLNTNNKLTNTICFGTFITGLCVRDGGTGTIIN